MYSVRFISLVRSIAKHGIYEGRCNSVIVKNAAFLCSHFGWQLVNFVYSKTDLSNSGFLSYFYNQVSDTEWREAELHKDVLYTRDDESEMMFADGSGLELKLMSLATVVKDVRNVNIT